MQNNCKFFTHLTRKKSNDFSRINQKSKQHTFSKKQYKKFEKLVMKRKINNKKRGERRKKKKKKKPRTVSHVFGIQVSDQ